MFDRHPGRVIRVDGRRRRFCSRSTNGKQSSQLLPRGYSKWIDGDRDKPAVVHGKCRRNREWHVSDAKHGKCGNDKLFCEPDGRRVRKWQEPDKRGGQQPADATVCGTVLGQCVPVRHAEPVGKRCPKRRVHDIVQHSEWHRDGQRQSRGSNQRDGIGELLYIEGFDNDGLREQPGGIGGNCEPGRPSPRGKQSFELLPKRTGNAVDGNGEQPGMVRGNGKRGRKRHGTDTEHSRFGQHGLFCG